jgi:hypothetical protein
MSIVATPTSHGSKHAPAAGALAHSRHLLTPSACEAPVCEPQQAFGIRREAGLHAIPIPLFCAV